MKLTDLPLELHIHILGFLDWEAHLFVSLTLRVWRDVVGSKGFQKRRYQLQTTNSARKAYAGYGNEPIPVACNILLMPKSESKYLWFAVDKGLVTAVYHYRPPSALWMDEFYDQVPTASTVLFDITESIMLDDPVFSPHLKLEETKFGAGMGRWKHDDSRPGHEVWVPVSVAPDIPPADLYKPHIRPDSSPIFDWRKKEDIISYGTGGGRSITLRRYLDWVAKEVYEDESIQELIPRNKPYRIRTALHNWGKLAVTVFPGDVPWEATLA